MLTIPLKIDRIWSECQVDIDHNVNNSVRNRINQIIYWHTTRSIWERYGEVLNEIFDEAEMFA